MPAVGLEARGGVVGVGELGVAVDGDVVVVVDDDEAAEAQVAGEGGGLVADALHEVAVAGDHVGAVVDEVGAEAGPQPALGDGHADGVGEALAERAGGDLDAGGVVHLGVARACASPTGGTGLEVVEGRGRKPVRCSIEYSRIEAWPADSTKRSRSGQSGAPAS